MSVNTGLKNRPSMKEMEIDNEIDKLLALSLSLHTEIDRPARVALAQERERAFGELYCNMSYEDKQQVLQRRCVGCKRISPGEEIFSSFFGIVECICFICPQITSDYLCLVINLHLYYEF